MEKSKLVIILGTFSKTELRDFEKFVSSPFFNKGRNYLPFLKLLTKLHPNYEGKNIAPEYIYSKLHPGKQFNKQIIWNQTSALLGLAEEYLAYINTKKKKYPKLASLAEEYTSRRLNSYYLKTLEEMNKLIDKDGIDKDFFLKKAAYENSMVTYHQIEDMQHMLCQNVLEEGKWVILGFLQQLARITCDLHSNAFMYNAVYDINIPSEFLKNINLPKIIEYSYNKKYEYAWLIEIYYCVILTVTDKSNTANYYRLKELFGEHSGKLSVYEKGKLIITLSNFCIMATNDGVGDFSKELFEINKLELKESLAFTEKSSSKITFIQILRNSLFFNEIEWAKEYVEENICKLKPAHRKSMYALAYAFIYFKLKEHDKVLENLNKVKFIDVRDKLNVKSLLIRTYLEMKDFNSLMYQIDSARHFLNSNPSINEKTKKNHILFLSFVTKFISAIEDNDKLKLEFFKNEVNKEQTLINKGWFNKHIDELLRTFSRIS